MSDSQFRLYLSQLFKNIFLLNVVSYFKPESMGSNYGKEFIWASTSIKLITYLHKRVDFCQGFHDCNFKWGSHLSCT